MYKRQAFLKLFFGADPRSIGRLRLLAHQSRLKEYELLRETGTVTLNGPLRVLEAAIERERVSIRLWTELVKSSE